MIFVFGEMNLLVINVVFCYKKDLEIKDWLKCGDEFDVDVVVIFDEVIESWIGLVDVGDNDLVYSMDVLCEMFDVYLVLCFDMLSVYFS